MTCAANVYTFSVLMRCTPTCLCDVLLVTYHHIALIESPAEELVKVTCLAYSYLGSLYLVKRQTDEPESRVHHLCVELCSLQVPCPLAVITRDVLTLGSRK